MALLMGPAGLVAILAGWFTTEIGRQPWLVYGVMRTADGVSAHGPVPLFITLALFVVVYFTVFGAGIYYVLRLIELGPPAPDSSTPLSGGPGKSRHPMRPLSAAPDTANDMAGAARKSRNGI